MNLEGVNLAGHGLVHLKGLKRLDHLLLNGSSVTDAGLANLQGSVIGVLELYDTRIGDSGLANLKAMPHLEILELGGTEVTDDGLVHLTGLPSLKYLWLENTDITDIGLAHLQRLTGLKNVNVCQTKVTAQGIAQFQKALPQCIVDHSAEIAGPETARSTTPSSPTTPKQSIPIATSPSPHVETVNLMNVCEWCQDWHARYDAKKKESVDPTGPEKGQHRVWRGGSFASPAANTRSATRLSFDREDYRPEYLAGFRVVRNFK